MRVSKLLLLLALTACATAAWAAPPVREPHIGYLFPAGGGQGSSFEVIVGGQRLNGAADVYVSGQGVHARVIKHYRPPRNINGEQRKELQRLLKELREKRIAEFAPEDLDFLGPWAKAAREQVAEREANAMAPPAAAEEKVEEVEPVELPDHPLLRDMEGKSLRQLQQVANTFVNFKKLKKRQLNPQLAEMTLIEVTIDPDAAPGDRELRLGAAQGLTNPMCFQVSTLPETLEQEPNDAAGFAFLPPVPPLDLPVVLNGQIMPGDIDRFRFRATQGRQLVVETHARHLIPYLADAVPGWFQATVALYDSQGREVAYADAYRFQPDPVLFYQIPADGEYQLEIRDSIYRGREDFVYRIAVGELPFVTQVFPLGGRTGNTTIAAVAGWNLPGKQLPFDTRPGDGQIRRTVLRQGRQISNEVPYAVDSLAECDEAEPNDDQDSAELVTLPLIVNGRIGRSGDVDVFRFQGSKGAEVVAEVVARRLHSPLDSLLRLTDAAGQVLAWNDDYMPKDGHLHTGTGLLTNYADSYLSARLPADGVYYVHLSDTRTHGGEAHAYRLRIAPPQPDFELRVTPSSLTVQLGRVVPITVHALRKDGFAGDIELALNNAPGFALSGAVIPTGSDRVRMTLRAPRWPLDQPAALELTGSARIGDRTVTRPATPADDVMQAFLYRHLAPARQLLVAVKKTKWVPPNIEFANPGPVRIPAGGTAEVLIKAPRYLAQRKVELELDDPPAGITVQAVTAAPGGLKFQLAAAPDAQPGLAGNLIVEAYTYVPIKKKEGASSETPEETQRVYSGILPAVSFVVVE